MLASASPASFELLLVVAALFIVFLCENARIPFDDPNTHLELTMIHEAMVLDHSGPDFGLINYTSALKLWVLGALIIGIFIPAHSWPWYETTGLYVAGIMLLAVITGILESVMARLRLLHVPRLLLSAVALSIIALLLSVR
jgi:formate hydrogenlyase subunit 4